MPQGHSWLPANMKRRNTACTTLGPDRTWQHTTEKHSRIVTVQAWDYSRTLNALKCPGGQMATLLELLQDLELIPERHLWEKILKISETTWLRMRNEGITPFPVTVIRRRRSYRPEVIEGWLRSNEQHAALPKVSPKAPPQRHTAIAKRREGTNATL